MGGNGAIGLGMAKGLAAAGAWVVFTARHQEKSRAAVDELIRERRSVGDINACSRKSSRSYLPPETPETGVLDVPR